MKDQLTAKQDRVSRMLASAPRPVPERIWEEPAVSAPTRFRNKAKMAVSGSASDPVLGLAFPGKTPVDLQACPLHAQVLEDAFAPLARHIASLGLEPYDLVRRSGELKFLLLTASPDGELMVRWVLRSTRHVTQLAQSLPSLQQELPHLRVASVNIQPVHQAILEGEEEQVLTEVQSLLMRLHLPEAGRELPLRLPTRSFFQTNTGVAEQLYDTAAAWAVGSGIGARARIWDLFCGVGGFALALAGADRSVLGVEVSASAIEGAKQAAADMGLSEEQVRFRAGDARVLDPGAGQRPDLLVVNPPRRGIGAELAGRIEAAGVPQVLYSSCNPASLAQDLASMPSYEPVRAKLFDMFPHTDHSEVLILLRRTHQ